MNVNDVTKEEASSDGEASAGAALDLRLHEVNEMNDVNERSEVSGTGNGSASASANGLRVEVHDNLHAYVQPQSAIGPLAAIAVQAAADSDPLRKVQLDKSIPIYSFF